MAVNVLKKHVQKSICRGFRICNGLSPVSRTTKLTRSFMVSLIRGTKLCNIHGTLRWRNQDSVVTSVPVASVHKSKSVRVEDACPSRRRHVILPKAGRQRNTTPYFAACANFTNQEWTQRFEFRWFGHPSVRLQSLQYNLKSGEIVSETTSFLQRNSLQIGALHCKPSTLHTAVY